MAMLEYSVPEERSRREAAPRSFASEPFMDMVKEDVAEVYEKVRKDPRLPAGLSDLRWVVNQPESSSETALFRDGNFHSFFGAVQDGKVPTICWYGESRSARFNISLLPLKYRWRSRNRAVFLP